MIKNAGHIISKCSWDTVFDEKNRAAELQNRLSSWSRLKMPGEIEDIFDKMCPEEQVWRIQSLVIDLGAISINSLEAELTLRLHKQLSKKLADLVLQRNEDGDDLAILDENAAHIYLISHFLLHGLLPWNYKNRNESINQILSSQLQSNHRELIEMIRDIGLNYENVRRRIAWQINESNIVKIIKGLEPNNNDQIIDLSNELTAIQERETIVQANLTDFKKNLWFWILNYLLTERGSAFNKIAFMKSNISQMAKHYNISYDELIGAIEIAVDRIAKYTILKADFIGVLATLVKENRSAGKTSLVTESTAEDLKTVLRNYLSGGPSPGYNYSIAELNDLVASFSKDDPQGFRESFLSLGDGKSIQITKISGLSEASLETIFSILSESHTSIREDDISFLTALCSDAELNVDRKFLWETGIQFLIGKSKFAFTAKEFLNYIITELSKKKGISKVKTLELLLCAEVPSGTRKVAALELFTTIGSIWVDETAKDESAVTNKRFLEVLDLLNDQIRGTGINKDLFIPLKRLATIYIRLHPKKALDILIEYKDKQGLQNLLPYVLDRQLISLLSRNAKKEISETLLLIGQSVTEFIKANTRLIVPAESVLNDIALQAMICNPGLKLHKCIELVLEYLGISANQKLPVLKQAALLMDKPGKQAELAKLLMGNFREMQFVKLREVGGKDSIAILNYLLKDGADLMDNLIEEYMIVLRRGEMVGIPANKIIILLKETYWKCMLDYRYHNGKAVMLRKLFDTIAWSAIPLPNKGVTGLDTAEQTRVGSNDSFRFKIGGTISHEEVFFFIEQCITLEQEVVIKNAQEIHLNELLITGLEINTHRIALILKHIPISERRIRILNSAVPFGQFAALIANDAVGEIGDATESVKVLHNLMEGITSGQIPEKVLYNYWRSVWHIIRENRSQPANLKSLVAASLHQLAVEKQADSAFVSSEIKKRHIRLTPQLKKAFTEYNTVFSIVPIKEQTKLSGELGKIKQNGLLYNLSYDVIVLKRIPLWFNTDEGNIDDVLHEIIANDPINIFLVLKHEVISERQIAWLCNAISFKTLIRAIAGLNQNQQSLLSDLEKLCDAFGKVTIKGVSVEEMRHFIFRKLITAWTTNNWSIVSGENMWDELVWDICVKKGGSKKQFVNDIEKVRHHFSASFQISFDGFKDRIQKPVTKKSAGPKTPKSLLKRKQLLTLNKAGIPVRNAGLVLANNYIPVLFERLGIMTNKTFTGDKAKECAIHYLQYMVTGLDNTEEHLLPLNKVICGLPLSTPLEDGIEISEESRNVIDGLIKAMISHWPAIGDNSVYGFRGNWLVRNGLLTELDDKWELIVEKRAYDILLNKSPFSFSIIKYPWMTKPLHVNWPH